MKNSDKTSVTELLEDISQVIAHPEIMDTLTKKYMLQPEIIKEIERIQVMIQEKDARLQASHSHQHAITKPRSPEQPPYEILSLIPDIVVICRKDGIIEYINNSCLENLNFKKHELLNKNIKGILEKGFSLKKLIEDSKREGHIINLLSSNKETIPVSVNINEITQEGKHEPKFLIIARNVRMLYKYHQEIEEQNKLISRSNIELKKALKNSEESDRLKTAFLANMSHEIRTPLNGIMGFAELLQSPGQSSTDLQYYGSIICTCGNQLLRVVNDVLDISKIEAGLMQITLAPHSINQVMDDMYAIYYQKKEQTNKNIRLAIHKDLPDTMCHVLIDDLRIKQILTNLLDNAFKFTLKGHIIFGYRIKMNTFEFFVEDTGMGIPRSQHEIIFKPFIQADQTTTRKYSGTGLGLAIAQGLVSLFNGRLWIDSIPEKGTTFYFTIPYVPYEIDHTSQKSFNIPLELQWNDKLILIVEDEHFNAEYLRSLLAPTGINMIFAVNGYQAIDKCLSNPSIDLVLMDIRLPDIDGLKVTEEIRKINKEVPIVALTAYASPEDKKRCLDGGCNDYVTKPVNSKDLLAVVRSYI